MNYSGMGGPESAAGGGGGINNGAHNGGNSGVNDAPISNTLQNRSALLRAIHTTERLRKRQEKEQIEDALRNPSNNHPSGGKGRSPMNLNYRSQSRQSRQSSSSSGSPIMSARSIAYSSYPVNASYPSSLGRRYTSHQYIP